MPSSLLFVVSIFFLSPVCRIVTQFQKSIPEMTNEYRVNAELMPRALARRTLATFCITRSSDVVQ
jgi:hypothetical protein